VPRTDPDHITHRIILPGDVPSPADPPPGCKFHPRCRYAQDVCSVEDPEWREVSDDHWVACHLTEDLNLTGIDYD
jgi:oligopeptide/dipeptide ABC transporter ATP-binding protein